MKDNKTLLGFVPRSLTVISLGEDLHLKVTHILNSPTS